MYPKMFGITSEPDLDKFPEIGVTVGAKVDDVQGSIAEFLKLRWTNPYFAQRSSHGHFPLLDTLLAIGEGLAKNPDGMPNDIERAS